MRLEPLPLLLLGMGGGREERDMERGERGGGEIV